jgi:hypothetical protein
MPFMEYRGIRYTIRARIERGEWFVAIHPDDVEMPGKIVSGGRERAETLAHFMIKRWLDKRQLEPRSPGASQASICARVSE